MLQEKASAVTDERVSRVQAETDLLPERSRMGLPTAPGVPSSEPEQVHTEHMASHGC